MSGTAIAVDFAPRGLVSKAEYYKALRRIDELEAELAELTRVLGRDKQSALTGAIHSAIDGLSPMQAAFLATLYRSGNTFLSQDGIYARGRFRRCEGQGATSFKVGLWHLRRALDACGAPSGAIENSYGLGYRLRENARVWLQERLDGL